MTYEYDGGHRVTKRTDAKGQETRYTYDAYGRLTQMQHWAWTCAECRRWCWQSRWSSGSTTTTTAIRATELFAECVGAAGGGG